jgi:hypothetical protein
MYYRLTVQLLNLSGPVCFRIKNLFTLNKPQQRLEEFLKPQQRLEEFLKPQQRLEEFLKCPRGAADYNQPA